MNLYIPSIEIAAFLIALGSLLLFFTSGRQEVIVFVLGSGSFCIIQGGHTTEMLRLIKSLDLAKFKPVYIRADSDLSSLSRLEFFYKDRYLSKNGKTSESLIIHSIPRSRSVKQSWLTTPFTTIWSLLHCVLLVLRYNIKIVSFGLNIGRLQWTRHLHPHMHTIIFLSLNYDSEN